MLLLGAPGIGTLVGTTAGKTIGFAATMADAAAGDRVVVGAVPFVVA